MSYAMTTETDSQLLKQAFLVEAADPNDLRDRWHMRISWATTAGAALDMAQPFFKEVGAAAWMSGRRAGQFAAGESVMLPAGERDEVIVWTDGKGVTSAVRARLFDGINDHAGKKVLLVTDLDCGVSVTNGAADIANRACELFEVDRKKLVFIEHYERAAGGAEHFAVTEFDLESRDGKLTRPRWRHLFSSAVRGVLGRVHR